MTADWKAPAVTDPIPSVARSSEPLAALVARYRRDAKGETVHRADCKSLRGRGSRWDFADGMTADQIVRTLARAPWLRACQVCRPDAQGAGR